MKKIISTFATFTGVAILLTTVTCDSPNPNGDAMRIMDGLLISGFGVLLRTRK